MDDSPFFSIIMPVYNREKFLIEAVESVINQTQTNWELVIVDDGSTDNSWHIIDSLNDSRIKKIRQNNKGAGGARNTGIENSTGEYIAFLDSDDLWLNNHLEIHFNEIIKKNSPHGIFHSFLIFHENGFESDRQDLIIKKYSDSLDYVQKTALFPTSTIIHRAIFKEFLFNEDIKVSIDAECFFRIAARYSIFSIPIHTAILRRHGQNLTVNGVKTYLRQAHVLRSMARYKEFENRIPKSYFFKLISNYYFYAGIDSSKFLNSYKYFYLSLRFDLNKLFSSVFIKSIIKRHFK